MHSGPRRSTQAEARSIHTETNCPNNLFLFPSLADQDEELLVRNSYVFTTGTSPAAGLIYARILLAGLSGLVFTSSHTLTYSYYL